jgi:hypothetical protein
VLDEGVRQRLGREASKNVADIVRAYHRGLASEDPVVALRAASGLMEEAFGRPGNAVDDEPSKMIQSVYRRPPREPGGPERLIVVLQDGRMLEAGELSFEPSQRVEPKPRPRVESQPGGPH